MPQISISDRGTRQVTIRYGVARYRVGRRKFLAIVDDHCRIKGTTLLHAEELSREMSIKSAAALVIYQRTEQWPV